MTEIAYGLFIVLCTHEGFVAFRRIIYVRKLQMRRSSLGFTEMTVADPASSSFHIYGIKNHGDLFNFNAAIIL